MTTSRRPVRRLPARVYWFRRAMVLGSVFAVIFAVAHLLGGGGNDPGRAAPAAANLGHPKAGSNGGPLGPQPLHGPSSTATGTPPPVALAQPDGPCNPDEITVTPVTGSSFAGGQVGLTLQLSGVQPACTFQVSSQTLVAKVIHVDDRVWTTQQCPTAVPKQSIVVRSAQPTTVQVAWSGRRSDASCSSGTRWAAPASYQVVAAVVGSEPAQAALVLKAPPQAVVTRTVTPKPKKVRTTTPTATANAGR